MKIEIRIYKRYDMDLVSLSDAGYPLATMLKEAVCGYANGQPVHFFIDEYTPFDLNDKKSFRTRFTVPDDDVNTIYLLTHIKHTWRNSFCKAVLRNALVQQSLTGFFSDENLVRLHQTNLLSKNINALQNVVSCSSIRENRIVQFGSRTIEIDKSKESIKLDKAFVKKTIQVTATPPPDTLSTMSVTQIPAIVEETETTINHLSPNNSDENSEYTEDRIIDTLSENSDDSSPIVEESGEDLDDFMNAFNNI